MKKKNRLLKTAISVVLSFSIFLGNMPMSFAQILQTNIDMVLPSVSIKDAIDQTSSYMYKNTLNPKIGTIGGEWTILSLARSGYNIPKEYYDKYYENVVNELKEKNGILDKRKYTEYSRVILGLTSIGKDVTNVGGYNLLEKLADFNKVKFQGINGPIFALIALDTNNYEIPIVEDVKVQTTREMLIDYILDKEIKKGTSEAGGWALSGNTPDPDITAMALQALAKYKDQEKIKPYIDRAIDVLSNIQLENGGYDSWGSLNSESIAQVIVALTALGIDPKTDSRFIKGDGKWTLSAVMEFYVEGGGFKHTLDGTVNAMATDQGAYAIVAYDRFVESKNSLYDMTDAFSEVPQVPSIDKSVENTVNYYKGLNNVLSWWDMLALTSAGEDIIKSPYKLPEWTSNIITTNTSVTSDAGYLLGLVSRGENPNSYTDKKVNLSKILADKQDKDGNLPGGVNAQIWGMIALEVTDEDYDREKALDSLISKQLNDGGFAFFGNQADPDMTGMALISLSFFKGNKKADESIEKAVECLNTIQKENGTFEAYNKENSNSTAMAMTGLMSVGEKLDEPKWKNIVDALMKFQIKEGVASGSYEYLIGQGSNLMATQQSLIAMGEAYSNKSLWHELDSMFEGEKQPPNNSGNGESATPSNPGNSGSILPSKPNIREEKLIGSTRYETAIKISQKGWDNAQNIVLVNGDKLPDALAATPFAKQKNAPILLTKTDVLNKETKEEIKRLKAKNVFIIGGKSVVSEKVLNELKELETKVERISGDTRFETSLEIAKRLSDISKITVVNGETGLSDATSIASVAANENMPILLMPTKGTNIYDQFIKDNQIYRSYVIGEVDAISKEIENKLPDSQRIGGANRNETNAKIISKFYDSNKLDNMFICKDGMNKENELIDALSVGVLASKVKSPVIIAGNTLNNMQKEILKSKSPKSITQIGGGCENAFKEIKALY